MSTAQLGAIYRYTLPYKVRQCRLADDLGCIFRNSLPYKVFHGWSKHIWRSKVIWLRHRVPCTGPDVFLDCNYLRLAVFCDFKDMNRLLSLSPETLQGKWCNCDDVDLSMTFFSLAPDTWVCIVLWSLACHLPPAPVVHTGEESPLSWWALFGIATAAYSAQLAPDSSSYFRYRQQTPWPM